MSEHHDLFWRGFLSDFRNRFPNWQAKVRNAHSTRHWVSCPSSVPSLLNYSASWSRLPTNHLKVEGYIELESKERTKEVFDTLLEQKDHLEEMVGDRLNWNRGQRAAHRGSDGGHRRGRKPDRKKSSIELWFPGSIEIADEERWPEAKLWLLDALGRMRRAFDPTLETLDRLF